VPERVPGNVTAEVLALINSFGALGAFAGSYLIGILYAVTGDERASYMLMSLTRVLCVAYFEAAHDPVVALTR
jgi:nitrate/nitrite transporter NarK